MRISRRLGLLSGGGGFKLPTYTGSYAIFGSAAQGYIELYSSGTLSLAKANYQVFAVGGGGGGGSRNSEYSYPGGGGGGGYTATGQLNLASDTTYNVTIGAGGSAHAHGGDTTIGNITAAGGKRGYTENAYSNYDSNGGSGGGQAGTTSSSTRNGGAGGSDGGSGYGRNGSIISSGNYYRGQGTTTRAFGDNTGTLYAGGGGGGGAYASSSGNGGTGGSGGGGAGGRGSSSSGNGTAGTANTGGGGGGAGGRASSATAGAGGSGIIIVRWGYAA